MNVKGYALGVVALIVVFIGGMYGYANSLYNTGVQYESGLSARYEANQVELSGFTVSFYEQLGLADRRTAAMDTIIQHAVSGRYGAEGFSADGAFFAAVAENYPDLNGLNIYDDIRRFVESRRAQFEGSQTILLDELRSYEQWRRTGLVRNILVGSQFPSNNLEARIGGQVVAVGADALKQIRTLVLDAGTNTSFASGTTQPLINP